MENLKELALLVNKQKVKHIEVIGNPSNYSGKMKKLYEGLITNKIETDEEALNLLYQTERDNGKLKKLKYRLQNRLINTVFFIDVNKPNYSDFQRAYYMCRKSFAAIEILLGRGVRKVAIELAERTLRNTIKYEFTEISLNLLKKLSRHYGVMEKDAKKFSKYVKLTQEYLDIFNAETLAEQYHSKLGIYTNETAAKNLDVIKEAEDYSIKLREFIGKVKSNRFLLVAYLVILTKYELENDSHGVLKICDEALESFGKKNAQYEAGIYAFTSKKINCFIQLKKYKEAEQEVVKALDLVPEGRINWYITYEKYMRMLFHKKDYQRAFEIFMNVSIEYGFRPVYKNILEIWKIYEAYFNFFIENSKIELSKSKYQPKTKFRINKFLNEVPTYSKDKRGLNIPILVIQILFHLQQKKYDPIIDKVEALNAYCNRYLKKDDTFRSNCFIKMLLLLPKCNFNRIAVERKSQNLLNKLKSVPLEVARQSAEIEIVPYEDLWEIVLEMLDTKFHKTRDV